MKKLCPLLLILLMGCATHTLDPQDPYEHFNRKVFAFNMDLDTRVLQPVARAYEQTLPAPAKKGIHNFFTNLGEITNLANHLLQAQWHKALVTTCRFAINSTLGIGGLFDWARKLGLASYPQDFGLTLAKWGAKNTPYLVLPFLGATTIRDAVAIPFDYTTNPWHYVHPTEVRYAGLAVKTIATRASYLMSEQLIAEAFDPYILLRNAYLQRRAYLVSGEASHSD